MAKTEYSHRMSLPTRPNTTAIFSEPPDDDHHRVGSPDPVEGDVFGRLAARVATARRLSGLTLAGVAERSGMSPAYVSQIESGTANPTLRALAQIAAAVDTDVEHLLGGADEQRAAGFEPYRSRAALAHSVSGSPGVWDQTAAGSRQLVARLVHGDAADHGEPVIHSGEEYVLVLRGTCRLHIGNAVHALGTGDACHFSAEQPHHVASASPDLTLSVVMSER
jgi:transcriptional regulator with XRE-family HTH domain